MSASDDKYNRSDKGRARHARYNTSAKGRARNDAYEATRIRIFYFPGPCGTSTIRVPPGAKEHLLRRLADFRAEQAEERKAQDFEAQYLQERAS